MIVDILVFYLTVLYSQCGILFLHCVTLSPPALCPSLCIALQPVTGSGYCKTNGAPQ